MATYRSLPPRPREKRPCPSYPKLLGLGALVLAAACGGSVESTGDIAAPFDSDAGGSAGAAGAAGQGGVAGDDNWPGGTGGGGIPYPYDSGVAGSGGTDIGVGGSAGGGAPYPYDAGDGDDAADAEDEEGSPPLQGEMPDPFDASADG